jgi:hypothetical protein
VQGCCAVAARYFRDQIALYGASACARCANHRSSRTAGRIDRAWHSPTWRLRCGHSACDQRRCGQAIMRSRANLRSPVTLTIAPENECEVRPARAACDRFEPIE